MPARSSNRRRACEPRRLRFGVSSQPFRERDIGSGVGASRGRLVPMAAERRAGHRAGRRRPRLGRERRPAEQPRARRFATPWPRSAWLRGRRSSPCSGLRGLHGTTRPQSRRSFATHHLWPMAECQILVAKSAPGDRWLLRASVLRRDPARAGRFETRAPEAREGTWRAPAGDAPRGNMRERHVAKQETRLSTAARQ